MASGRETRCRPRKPAWAPPTFRNPSARYQQWEQPLTQIRYDRQGVIVEVGGSGTGVLCQGDLELIRCGEPEEAVARAFGKGEAVNNLYRYPVTPYPGIGRGIFVEIFCGSQSGSKRWVSHLQLTVPDKDAK